MASGAQTLPSGTVTFMFTDIEGSTHLVEALGDAWPDVLASHRRILRAAFERHAGVEKGTEGDSFFVAFRDAPAAVAAAVEAQQGLAGAAWPDGVVVRVRMGLLTGEGRVEGGDYVGFDVHRAARIAAAAHGGQVVISEGTRALVERRLPDGVTVRDLGPHRLKDLIDPEHLFQLDIAGLPSDFPPLHSIAERGNLPIGLTSFIGRRREVGEVAELVRSSRLVTLVGPAGIGKSRLALEAARSVEEEFRDGVWLVPLASVTDPGHLLPAIATSVGVREVGSKPPAAVLRDHFRSRRCLVVLDNFEQLLAAAPVVSELLADAPGLTFLVTSQAELRLSSEHLFPVPPLGDPPGTSGGEESDAARLFIDRARSAVPDLIVTPDVSQAIEAICAKLDGLPLAIELAAARVRLLGVEEILRRLENRLQLLSGGPADAPDRHRTLRAAIGWSYDLLGVSEAVLFRRLSVFNGGATFAAVEQICADSRVAEPLSSLDELVRHSLVEVQSRGQAPRYRMLGTIREFALNRLQDSGEAETIRRRHAEWYAALLESIGPRARLQPSSAVAAEVEIDNIESALGWATDSGEIEVGLRICGWGWRVWHRSRRLRQGRAWTDRVLELGDPNAFPEARMRALEALGGLAYWLEDVAAAVSAYRARLGLALDLGLPSEVADAHLDLWFAFRSLGDNVSSREELLAAQTGYEAIGDDLGTARCRWAEVSLWVMDHRFGEARDALEEVLAVFRQRRDVSYEGLAVGSLAMCAIAAGDLAAADRWFREALALATWSGVTGVITSLGVWSQLLDRIGRPQLAARTQGAYEALSETYGVQIPRGLRDIIAFVRSQADAPATLAPAERRRLVEEGRRMTLDDVVEAIGDLSQRESAPAPGQAVARQPARSGRTKAASGAHVTSTRRPTS